MKYGIKRCLPKIVAVALLLIHVTALAVAQDRGEAPQGDTAANIDWNAPSCNEVRSHDEADLCQQQRMVSAAEETVWWTRAQAGIAAVGTLFLIWNLIYARRATKAAIDAARISKDMLVADQRAWITTNLRPHSGFDFFPTGAGIGVALDIKNIGKTPALNVHTKMEIMTGGYEVAAQAARQFALKHRQVNTEHSRVLLPGDSYVRLWGLSLEEDTYRDKGFFAPFIVGCVTYQVLPDHSLHQTAFVYHVEKGKDGTFVDTIQIDENVPKEGVLFIVGSGGIAD